MVLAALAAVAAVGAAVGLAPSALLIAAGAGAAAVAVAAGLGYRLRPSATYLARLVEQERPELKESLVTLVELAADASSDRSMQTALARRAARILSRDPPHAFLPDISWRRPGWTLAASAVMLAGVLWMAKGTAVAPWLPGAAAGTQTVASAERCQAPSSTTTTKVPDIAPARAARGGAGEASQGAEGSGGAAQGGAADGRRGACAARGGAGEASQGDGAGGVSQGVEGSGDAAQGGVADGRRDARAARDGADGTQEGTEGPGNAAQGEAADVRPGARAARDGAGGAPQGAGGRAARDGTARAAAGPPLPQRNPSDAAPENVLDTMRQGKPLMEKDDRSPEGNDPPRPFLGKMGVSTADDRRYTTAWPGAAQRPKAGSDASSVVGSARTVTGTPDGRLIDAAGDAGARPVVVPADAAAGERGALIHAAEVRVSPRLRPAVRAYFERIGRLTAGE
ncbi:MAG: hypothetical protein R6X20_13200 [Phycisphaerae bacterium]